MSDGAVTRPPRRRWLIVVAAVSIALNLFFIGMIAGHMHRHHPPLEGQRERFDRIVGHLGLNDAQKTAFQQFQATMRRQGTAMRAANTAAWAKIADPATPPDQIAGLLNGTVKARTDFQQDVAAAMGKFLASLTPAQRGNFIEEARNGRGHGPRH